MRKEMGRGIYLLLFPLVQGHHFGLVGLVLVATALTGLAICLGDLLDGNVSLGQKWENGSGTLDG